MGMSKRDRNAGYNNRTLLRFTARFWNRGTADFRSNNNKEFWEWHRCHQHFHSMERFADYDLTDMKGNKVAEGDKAIQLWGSTTLEATGSGSSGELCRHVQSSLG